EIPDLPDKKDDFSTEVGKIQDNNVDSSDNMQNFDKGNIAPKFFDMSKSTFKATIDEKKELYTNKETILDNNREIRNMKIMSVSPVQPSNESISFEEPRDFSHEETYDSAEDANARISDTGTCIKNTVDVLEKETDKKNEVQREKNSQWLFSSGDLRTNSHECIINISEEYWKDLDIEIEQNNTIKTQKTSSKTVLDMEVETSMSSIVHNEGNVGILKHNILFHESNSPFGYNFKVSQHEKDTLFAKDKVVNLEIPASELHEDLKACTKPIGWTSFFVKDKDSSNYNANFDELSEKKNNFDDNFKNSIYCVKTKKEKEYEEVCNLDYGWSREVSNNILSAPNQIDIFHSSELDVNKDLRRIKKFDRSLQDNIEIFQNIPSASNEEDVFGSSELNNIHKQEYNETYKPSIRHIIKFFTDEKIFDADQLKKFEIDEIRLNPLLHSIATNRPLDYTIYFIKDEKIIHKENLMNLDIDKMRRKLLIDWIGTNSIVEIENKVTECVCFVFNSKMIQFIDQFLQNESNKEISYEKLVIEATHWDQFHINDHFYVTNNKQTLLETGNSENDSIVFRKSLIEKTEYFKKNSTCFENNNLQICQKNFPNLKKKFTRSISDPYENVKKCNCDDQTRFKSFFALNSSQNIFKIYITSSEYNSNGNEVIFIKYQNKNHDNDDFADKSISSLVDYEPIAANDSDKKNPVTSLLINSDNKLSDETESVLSSASEKDSEYFKKHYRCVSCKYVHSLMDPYAYEHISFDDEEPNFFIREICDNCRNLGFNDTSSTESELFYETDNSIMRKNLKIWKSSKNIGGENIFYICLGLFYILFLSFIGYNENSHKN
ncbi:hypothetical protein EDEG_03947, partial [Edhazardia aedis USNM 41457]